MRFKHSQIPDSSWDGKLFSKEQLRRLVIPLMVEQTLAMTVGLFDTLIVSSVGETAVSAVSLVDSINFLLITLFAALGAGGAIVVGQYIGAQKHEEARHAAKQLLLIVTLLSIGMMILFLTFNHAILRFIFGNIDSAIMENAQVYFFTTSLSLPFLAVFNVCAALFRIMGNSAVPMVNAIVINIVNIAANILFIFGFDMGVLGSASATSIARIVGAVIILIMLRNPKMIVYIRSYNFKEFDGVMIKRILKLGIPNGLESSIFQIGKIIMSSLVATFTTSAIAAHAVGNSLTSVGIVPAQAMSLAITTVVSQCVGARDYEQAEFYTRYLIKKAYIYLWILNILMLLILNPALSLYGLSPEGFSIAYEIMVIHGVGAMIMWPLSFSLPNTFRASGDVVSPMIFSIFSMLVVRIGFSFILVYVFNMGVVSVWWAMMADWAVRSIFFTHHYKHKKWQRYAPASDYN
ncbi:MATE family efflux transporter [Bavariicoccus seileri]|uniref:MATE family efflux transporter n=1 Tax=Bavariicoccus seileri TaxID=549685 RepID=UPI003F91AF5C